MFEYLLLGFLMEQPQSGYHIKQQIELGTSNFIRSSYGSIYPTLKRLQSKGLLTCKEQVNNGRFTKTYTITDKGVAYFMDWLRIPADISSGSHEHLAKMYFYDQLDKLTRHAHFRQYIKQAHKIKQTLLETEKQAKALAGPNRLTTLFFGIHYYGEIAAYYERRLDEENSEA